MRYTHIRLQSALRLENSLYYMYVLFEYVKFS